MELMHPPAPGDQVAVGSRLAPTRTRQGPAVGGVFPSTRWHVVAEAGRHDTPGAAAALEQICHGYWYPLYAFVRRSGRPAEEARDLTQSFFLRLLAKDYLLQADRTRGRFRTFLLSALKHFLADEWDRSRRLKRGGDRICVSFDAVAAEERYRLEPVDPGDPTSLFDRRWALT